VKLPADDNGCSSAKATLAFFHRADNVLLVIVPRQKSRLPGCRRILALHRSVAEGQMYGRHRALRFKGLLARCGRQLISVVAVSWLVFSALTANITIAVAEDWSPPKGVASWKDKAKCAKCQDIQDKINTAWEKRWLLAAQDLTPNKINTEMNSATQSEMKAQKAAATGGLQDAFGDKYKDGKTKEAKDPLSKQNAEKTK
jgi:hypothetical protein